MIQRIQSIYLLIAIGFSVACLCMQIGTFNLEGMVMAHEYNLWITDLFGHRQFTTWPLFAVLLFSAALGVYSIFSFNNRKMQMKLCLFNTLLLLGWFILFVVMGQVMIVGGKGATGSASFAPSIAAFFPAASIVFYMLANKAIKADERLVRAADRIR